MIIKKDIKEIEKALHLDEGSVKAVDDNYFSGTLNHHNVLIVCGNIDKKGTLTNITSVKIATEANNIKVTATFRAPDWKDISVESCFTVKVNGALRKEERDDLIIRLAPDMAKLQGLPGYNVEVVSIEEDTE